ncbi:hypothetical protein LMB83_10890 [Limosilactobacillus reuteri]|uniref:hypothetical protein n=1 Tax=Limosilactobacillus reuteri TaxID=1598 RepID=UPI001E391BE6|nr:hypothetical protein [Limosilactobacillus reuteri]MCC4412413.1 hypothetical protein [Limosilactobacillus reuteri]MCC4412533.1 hypothetical protein [Limosilactobacillus reuteri]
MKINEFIKKVNKIFYAEYSYDSNTIYVYKTEQDMCDENKYDDTYYFMSVKVCDKKFSLFFDPDWMPEDVKGLSLLFNLLRELEETPIKNRFSKKKYTIQVIANYDSAYLNCHKRDNRMTFCDDIETDYVKTRFTQSEIDELKQRPDLAIDWNKAIIKEVKDDED